jgi:predicted DCC family thiol-disulfide oxidoreductase YuxK
MSLVLVYDGDCPLCRNSAKAVRLKASVGSIEMVDARVLGNHPIRSEIMDEGLDLNEGIVVKFEGKLYHGSDALHLLALLGSSSDRFNRFNAWIFRSKIRTDWLYPYLKAARRLSLWVQRKPLL